MPATPLLYRRRVRSRLRAKRLELFLHTLTTEPQRTGNACFIGASVERPAMSAAAIRAPRDLDEAPFDLSDRKTPHNGPIAQYY